MGKSKNPMWVSFSEWSIFPKRWWNMLSVLLSAIPLGYGVYSYTNWAISAEANPPLPIWNPILIIAGTLLFVFCNFWVFHKVRTAKDNFRLEGDKLLIELENKEVQLRALSEALLANRWHICIAHNDIVIENIEENSSNISVTGTVNGRQAAAVLSRHGQIGLREWLNRCGEALIEYDQKRDGK